MADKKQMKTGLFGYKKKQVHLLLEEMEQNFAREKAELEDALEVQKRQAKTLLEENTELSEKLRALEKEREYVSAAIVRAEQEAREIVAAATDEAQARKGEIDRALEAQKGVLADLKQEVRRHKESLLGVMDVYKKQLENLE